MTEPKLEDFATRSYDKLRYGDTDRQGHVNNVAFATFFETGRVEMAEAIQLLIGPNGLSLVVARIGIDYRREVFWPGIVECGTLVAAIGNSSVTLRQALFQNGVCVATAESVVVQVDTTTHRAAHFDESARAALTRLMTPG